MTNDYMILYDYDHLQHEPTTNYLEPQPDIQVEVVFHPGRSLVPNIITWTSLISSCESSQWQRALVVFQQMTGRWGHLLKSKWRDSDAV